MGLAKYGRLAIVGAAILAASVFGASRLGAAEMSQPMSRRIVPWTRSACSTSVRWNQR